MHQSRDFPKDFTPLAVIGKSHLQDGVVICASHVSDRRVVAVKCIDMDACTTSMLSLLQHEVRLSRTLHHPNICIYSSVFLHNSKLCMTAPIMEYGSCADIMAAHFKYGLPERVIALILREILKALSYMHSMKLIHRGLKGTHILISKNGEIKLAGHRNVIELCRDGAPIQRVHDFPQHDTSMLPWLSPEILQQNMQGYDTKSDIYSLGITACELANGHAPFIDMPSTQMLLEKLNGTIPFLLDDSTVCPALSDGDEMNSSTINLNHEVTRMSMIRTAQSRRFSPLLHKFVTDCLEREPEMRPTADEQLKHTFFKQLKNHTNKEILQPVFKELHPLGENAKGLESDLNSATHGLGAMDIDDLEWDFSS